MQIEGLNPFKSSIDQAIASLYFLRISSSFCSSSSVNVAEITTGFAFSSSKKAYFKYLGNLFNANPSELVFVSLAFSSLLLDFSVMFSSILSTAVFYSKLEFRNSTLRTSRYWKFISFSFIELLILQSFISS